MILNHRLRNRRWFASRRRRIHVQFAAQFILVIIETLSRHLSVFDFSAIAKPCEWRRLFSEFIMPSAALSRSLLDSIGSECPFVTEWHPLAIADVLKLDSCKLSACQVSCRSHRSYECWARSVNLAATNHRDQFGSIG